MTRNYFSRRGGPYFVSDGVSRHRELPVDKGLNSVSTIGKIRAFFKFPRFGRKK